MYNGTKRSKPPTHLSATAATTTSAPATEASRRLPSSCPSPLRRVPLLLGRRLLLVILLPAATPTTPLPTTPAPAPAPKRGGRRGLLRRLPLLPRRLLLLGRRLAVPLLLRRLWLLMAVAATATKPTTPSELLLPATASASAPWLVPLLLSSPALPAPSALLLLLVPLLLRLLPASIPTTTTNPPTPAS